MPPPLPSFCSPLFLPSTERPDPPIELTVDSVTSEQASLSWLPSPFDGNRPVLQYRILQRSRSNVDDTADFIVATIQPVDTLTLDNGRVTYTLSQGLVPFSFYDFAVQACNVQGCSDLSDPSAVTRTLPARKLYT